MTDTKKINIIVACTYNGGIGFDDTMCWHIPAELKKFKEITSYTLNPNKKNAIIMGRKTWESIPKKPLPERINIIITSNINYKDDRVHHIVNSIDDALIHAKSDDIENIFIIGGESIYNNILTNYINIIDKIYLSVLFDTKYKTNKYIDIDTIYKKFILKKHIKYEYDASLYASFICYKSIDYRSIA